AEQLFVEALDGCNVVNAKVLLAFTQCDFAQMLLDRKSTGDLERAQELVGMAVKTADLLSIEHLGGKARLLKDRINRDAALSENPLVRNGLSDSKALSGPVVPISEVTKEDVPTTVLFIDMVSSTEHAARMGNYEWRRVLAQFYGVVRKAFAAHDGKEISNPG